MRLFTFLFFTSIIIAQVSFGQNRKAHIELFSDFPAFNLNTGGLDEYGNAYLGFGHYQSLVFFNDSIQAINPNGTSFAVCKIRPSGELIWYSQPSSFIFDLEVYNGENSTYTYGNFEDTLIWEGITFYESNPSDSLFDTDVIILKFDNNGNLKYSKQLDPNILRIENLIEIKDKLYFSGEFKNQIILGTDTLNEDSVSFFNGLNDNFLSCLDQNGDYVFGKNIGSSSSEVILDLIIKDTSILLYGYYFTPPTILPTISTPSFIYLEFDTIGTLINNRPIDLPTSTPFLSLEYNSNNELITREFNDSAENQILANTVYGGQKHVGFYKYPFGAFNPPSNGIAFGGDTVELVNNSNDEISFSENLISNFIKHPSGITYDGVNIINSPYSIMAFNSETMDVEYYETSSGELDEIDIKSGFQLFAKKMVDTVLQIDTLIIQRNFQNDQFLLYYTGDCDFFKPERVISQTGDSLYIEKGQLEIEWYKDNGTAVPNSLNEESIRLVGAGTYYTELRNYFGCTYYSDTVNIVSSLDDQELFEAITVYPNPTKGELNFDLPKELIGVELSFSIMNMNGSVLIQKNVHSQMQSIDISSLQTGIYIYELKGNNQLFRGKVVKQ